MGASATDQGPWHQQLYQHLQNRSSQYENLFCAYKNFLRLEKIVLSLKLPPWRWISMQNTHEVVG